MSLACSPTPAIHLTMARSCGSRGSSKSCNWRLLAMTHVMKSCGRRFPSIEKPFSVVLRGMRCSDDVNNHVLNKKFIRSARGSPPNSIPSTVFHNTFPQSFSHPVPETPQGGTTSGVTQHQTTFLTANDHPVPFRWRTLIRGR